MTYNLSLTNFLSTDNLQLPALLYEPKEKTKKVALFLHGNGSSSIFYKKAEMDAFGSALTNKGISFFPFNNRGAHIIKKLNRIINGEKERIAYGMTYEIIKECVFDINGAIDYLKTLGYEEFYLIGSSTGANKIVVYNYYQPENPVSKYILLAGGDDTGIWYQMLGEEKFKRALKGCPEHIKRGKGRSLAPKNIVGEELMSFQSLYDTINPDGDYNIFSYHEYINNLQLSNKLLFKEIKSINKKTLVVYGEFDEYCSGAQNAVDILKKQITHPEKFTFEIIPGADHGFTEKEKELATVIAQWL